MYLCAERIDQNSFICMRVIGQDGGKQKVVGHRMEMRRTSVAGFSKTGNFDCLARLDEPAVADSRSRLLVGDLWDGVYTRHKGQN